MQEKIRGHVRSNVIGFVALFALIVVPVALAGTGGGPQATASGVKQKVKKLTKQVQQLQQQLDALVSQTGPQGPAGPQGPEGPAGPSTGPAGGDLTGNYPNPSIANDAVNSAKVADGSLAGLDIENNSLTGADIDESSLGTVPSASQANFASSAGSAGSATTATNVNGLQVRAFHYAENANSAAEGFLSLNGLLLGASCNASGNIQLIAQSNANDSYIRSSNNQSDPDFDSGQTIDLDTPDTDGTRFLSFRSGAAAANSTTFDSNSVSATVVFDSNPVAGPACQASGTAMGRP